jgi:hypothetical protein
MSRPSDFSSDKLTARDVNTFSKELTGFQNEYFTMNIFKIIFLRLVSKNA